MKRNRKQDVELLLTAPAVGSSYLFGMKFVELQRREIDGARTKHRPINSAHEGYSVILEELDEFWEEVRKKRSVRSKRRMVAELVQIAAMAQRTAEDVCMDRSQYTEIRMRDLMADKARLDWLNGRGIIRPTKEAGCYVAAWEVNVLCNPGDPMELREAIDRRMALSENPQTPEPANAAGSATPEDKR